MISAGALIHHFYIDTATESVNGSGQLILDWDNATSVRRWGRFIPKAAKVYELAQQQYSNMTWLLEMRGRLSISGRNRIRTNDTPARVLEVIDAWGADGESVAKADLVHVAVREATSVATANPV